MQRKGSLSSFYLISPSGVYSRPLRRLRAFLVYLLRKSPTSRRATPKPKAIISIARYCWLWPDPV
jgi:hypothetical protein